MDKAGLTGFDKPKNHDYDIFELTSYDPIRSSSTIKAKLSSKTCVHNKNLTVVRARLDKPFLTNTVQGKLL